MLRHGGAPCHGVTARPPPGRPDRQRPEAFRRPAPSSPQAPSSRPVSLAGGRLSDNRRLCGRRRVADGTSLRGALRLSVNSATSGQFGDPLRQHFDVLLGRDASDPGARHALEHLLQTIPGALPHLAGDGGDLRRRLCGSSPGCFRLPSPGRRNTFVTLFLRALAKAPSPASQIWWADSFDGSGKLVVVGRAPARAFGHGGR